MPDVRLLQASATALPLPDASVHMVCTSPPYWGLRSYKGEQEQEWGGLSDCQHEWEVAVPPNTKNARQGSTETIKWSRVAGTTKVHGSNTCRLCGAWRGGLGHEPTIGMYVQHIVECFREVRRVLRDDGTLWLNIGDCWAGSGGGGGGNRKGNEHGQHDGMVGLRPPTPQYLHAGDLCGIPHKVRDALLADGWRRGVEIVWAKAREDPDHDYAESVGSTMPESTDGWKWERCRVKVKSLRPGNNSSPETVELHRPSQCGNNPSTLWANCPGCPKCAARQWVCEDCDGKGCEGCFGKGTYGLVLAQGQWRPTDAHEFIFMFSKTNRYYADREAVAEAASDSMKPGRPFRNGNNLETLRHDDGAWYEPRGTRNLRDVWVLKHQQSEFAHYATFPLSLPTRCIQAATPETGVCSVCGAPWTRVVSNGAVVESGDAAAHDTAIGRHPVREQIDVYAIHTLGWLPTCSCLDAPTAPAVVCDPFVGTGTTCVAALRLGRSSIGVDTSLEYLDMARKRLGAETLPLEVEP